LPPHRCNVLISYLPRLNGEDEGESEGRRECNNKKVEKEEMTRSKQNVERCMGARKDIVSPTPLLPSGKGGRAKGRAVHPPLVRRMRATARCCLHFIFGGFLLRRFCSFLPFVDTMFSLGWV